MNFKTILTVMIETEKHLEAEIEKVKDRKMFIKEVSDEHVFDVMSSCFFTELDDSFDIEIHSYEIVVSMLRKIRKDVLNEQYEGYYNWIE